MSHEGRGGRTFGSRLKDDVVDVFESFVARRRRRRFASACGTDLARAVFQGGELGVVDDCRVVRDGASQ